MSSPVCVLWRDTLNASGWHDLDTARKENAPLVETYGVILKRTKMEITIAHGMSGNQCLGYTVIPAGMIKRVRRLK